MLTNGIRATLLLTFTWAAVAVTTLTARAQSPSQSPASAPAPAISATAPAGEIRIVEAQGDVQVLPQGATAWTRAQAGQVLHPLDRLKSAENSRMAVRWSDQSVVSFGASTELEILAPQAADDQAGLNLVRGIFSFFHRDKPGHIHIITHGAMAGVEGTEFALAVDNADNTTVSVVDGKVRFGNEQSTLLLTNGEQAVTAPGQAPKRTAGFIANNLLQWCFYYPAVLDPDELQLSDSEQKDLSKSLEAYRSGDLLPALDAYPTNRSNVSDSEKVYHAALLLSVGEVAGTESILSSVGDTNGRPARLSTALRQLIAAVKLQPSVLTTKPELASELMADSYFEQSRAAVETSLENALQLARQATVVSPKFGFAWERVAELEFCFGRSRDAMKALDTSHALSPRNAQAMALTGFVLSAQDKPKEARKWFDRAITTDGALGNAWLGRGLVRIRTWDKAGGKEDLLMAAALEPQRAELRSYLGKAYAVSGDDKHAAKELNLAKTLDPKDPTAWLYSALLNQQDNQINDAIRDLEKSQELNNNRSVYRSQLLLDEDSAVRSANLAWMYQDDGMFDLSVREAGRAVSTDYANFSSHLFLSDSYNQLRDPNWANLRYETPAVSESWIANLLAPTSAGWLSDGTSKQQPYARMFDQNRVGIVSDTTYLARDYKGRAAITDEGDAFGTFDNFSFDFGSFYQFDPGQRPNESLDDRELDLSLKYQLTPQDSAFVSIQQVKRDNGDLNEYYNQANASTALKESEKQWPNLFVGYHHEWSPGVHTLFLASRSRSEGLSLLADDAYALHEDAVFYNGAYNAVRSVLDQTAARIATREYSTELQQIWETPKHTTIVGSRFFWGDIRFKNIEFNPDFFSNANSIYGDLAPDQIPDPTLYPNAIQNQNFVDNFHHLTAYAYHDWQIFDPLKVSAGLAYDYLDQPYVVNTTPFSTEERDKNQVSPKAGLIWNPLENTVFRAAYTRSLSGFVNDSGIRLEPTEVAGFNQAYRSVMPDTVVGDTSGARIDTIDVSLEQKFGTGTYLALSGELLDSHLLKGVGAYFYDTSDASTQVYPIPQPMRESLDYKEKSLTFDANQLLGKQWAVGARYRVSQANLNESFVDIPPNLPAFEVDPPFVARQNMRSLLHTVVLHANWNHPSGLFSILEADWYHQNNRGFSEPEPGDDFWQCNVSAGYRFWHRRAEISGGILNVFDQNYSLEPLNLYNEMARTRTFFVRVLVSF